MVRSVNHTCTWRNSSKPCSTSATTLTGLPRAPKPAPVSTTFNLGPADEGIPLRTLVNCLLDALGSGAAVHYQGGDRGWAGDIPRYSYSTARINRLGWRARMSSLEAVQLACSELARQSRLAESRP